MPIKGNLKKKNLKANEKIKDDSQKSNLKSSKDKDKKNKKDKDNNSVQTLTVGGIDYPVRKADGSFFDDESLDQFKNKDVDVEGTFVGPILIISSIKKA